MRRRLRWLGLSRTRSLQCLYWDWKICRLEPDLLVGLLICKEELRGLWQRSRQYLMGGELI